MTSSPNFRITALPDASGISDDDFLPTVQNPSVTPATVKARFSQLASWFLNRSNNIWTGSNSFSDITITGGSISGVSISGSAFLPADSAYGDIVVSNAGLTWSLGPIARTWNNGATTFDVIDANITDTASAADSRVARVRVNGSTVFAVDKAGLLTIVNTGLRVLDTDASHVLSIVPGSNLTANRTLTVTTGDANRVLTISGDATISGTNSGDQTITLTGDVTGGGTGSFATTIANSAVTYAKMQDVSATDRVLGRSSAGAGVVQEIVMTAFGRSLVDDVDAAAARATLALGTIATQAANSVAITGGSIANITDLAVADGGTGASDAPTARANLGLAIGTNVQAFDQTLAVLAAYNTNGILTQTAADTFVGRSIAAGSGISVTNSDGVAGNPTIALGTVNLSTTQAADSVGTRGVPQNSRSANYTLVIDDAGQHIFHPASDNNPRTFTIPANASVAFPVGTTVTFVNKINTVTIAITSDTLTLAGSGSTGSRTLAANGMATALKITATEWMISGTGLS